MNFFSNLNRSQRILTFPFITGFISGLAGVVYLFSIPADPKNSLIFGFSSFRLLEGAGLILTALVFLFLIAESWKKTVVTEKIIKTLGWLAKYPWSIVLVWLGFSFSLFVVIYGSEYFQGYAAIISRLIPVLYWIITFSLAFFFSYLLWAKWKVLRTVTIMLFVTSVIVAGLIILVGTLVNPALFGLMLRQGSLIYLLILFVNLVFTFQQKRFLGTSSSFLVIALLFGGAIAGVWSSAVSDLNIIAGLLPFNDANGYFHGGRVMAEGQLLFPFSARRPLFPALMGVFLWLSSQNLQFAIGCFVLISALVVFFSSKELINSAGAIGAAFFVFGILLFARRFIGSTMSEVLGLPLGTIGFAFLWRGAVHQRLKEVAAGMLLVTLGLLSRAGPFFILPFLLIWSGWGLRGEKKYNWKALIAAGLAIGLGFLCNSIIFSFLAGSNSAAMSNFSYTLYGLVVGGKGWQHFMVDHPELNSVVEPFRSHAIYHYAWQAFLSNPMDTVEGALKYWRAFFSFQWYGVFAYIDGASKNEAFVGRIVMALLSLAGFVAILRKIRTPAISMLFAGVIGIVLSVPFVPTLDAEIRTYAAAIPWFVGLGMVGLLEVFGWIKRSQVLTFDVLETSKSARGLWVSGFVLFFLMVLAPLIVHEIKVPIVIPQQTNCSSGEDNVITTVNHGSYVNIRADDSLRQTMIPDIRYSDFIRSMHDSPMYRLAVQLMPVSPGTSYLSTYNWADKQFENVLAPTEMLDQNQGWVEMCGWREAKPDEYGFFHAESIRLLK